MNGLPDSMGKAALTAGAVLIVVGLLTLYGGRIPFFGKLPGDIFVKRENFTFYFPLATCIVISAVIYLVSRYFQK